MSRSSRRSASDRVSRGSRIVATRSAGRVDELAWLCEAPDHGLLDRAVEVVLGEQRGQVVQRPRGRREGQAEVNRCIEGGGSVDPDARAAPCARRDVDVAVMRWAEAPDRRGRVVAQDAAGREDRCRLTAVQGLDGPDAVDAAVQPRQPAVRNAVGDAASPEARRVQLRGRDNPALTGGEHRDRGVSRVRFVALIVARVVRATFRTYAVHFVARTLGGGVSATKCTRWEGARGQASRRSAACPPYMRMFLQTRHEAAAKRSATLSQSTVFHHASM